MSLFERTAEALIAASKARGGLSYRACLDLIPGSLLTDCWREYAARPQTCVGGGVRQWRFTDAKWPGHVAACGRRRKVSR
jgi:hypothetical protein